MGYCSANCKDEEHTCTAWDGKGSSEINHKPNHNLAEFCPEDVTKCEYRKKKIKAKPF